MTKLYTDQGLIEHKAKIKAGLEIAKKKGKKLGRPKGGKIKGEDEVTQVYNMGWIHYMDYDQIRRCSNAALPLKVTQVNIAKWVGVSKGTVQKIINKYKNND